MAPAGGSRRLDTFLVEEGHFSTRERARSAILAGAVRVDGQSRPKPGTPVAPGRRVEVLADPCPYVSRGGLKLEWALDCLGVDPRGRVALDAGASTGGFTDCLLRRGARLVYAVDVGYGQLAWQLRNDPRVRVMERTNLRYLRRSLLEGDSPDLATLDLAFISLALVLPAVAATLGPAGEMLALVKPQFEVGRGRVGRRGVVRDAALHREALLNVAGSAGAAGLKVAGVTASPLKGPEGNREFWLWLLGPEHPGAGAGGLGPGRLEEEVGRVVAQAHAAEESRAASPTRAAAEARVAAEAPAGRAGEEEGGGGGGG